MRGSHGARGAAIVSVWCGRGGVEGGTGHEIYNSAQGDALIDEAIAWISARA